MIAPRITSTIMFFIGLSENSSSVPRATLPKRDFYCLVNDLADDGVMCTCVFIFIKVMWTKMVGDFVKRLH